MLSGALARVLHRPQVVCGVNLTGCTAALVLDRAVGPSAAARQLRLDNRKAPARLALEGPSHAAALLLLRGARCAVVAAAPTTAWAHSLVAGALLKGMAAEGRSAGAAAMGALAALGAAGYELQAVREAGLVVWGLPHAAAQDAAGDGARKGGKAAAVKK